MKIDRYCYFIWYYKGQITLSEYSSLVYCWFVFTVCSYSFKNIKSVLINKFQCPGGVNFMHTSSFKLDPNWITGFTDAEGCFTIIISKRPSGDWRVKASFEINLHTKDIKVLYGIQQFFGVGSVTSREERSTCVYRVTSIVDLMNVIIPHFNKFPLLTNKNADFMLWSKVVKMMSQGLHNTKAGFATILTYYAAINKGLSPVVAKAFPDVIPIAKIFSSLPLNLNPFWVSGFVAGDGGFSIGIRKTGQVYFRFHIAQHSRDALLMESFSKFFNCGKVNVRATQARCDFYVQSFDQIYKNVIPHFDSYPLNNIKELDFEDFKKAAELFKTNGSSSRDQIRDIISNMNSNRQH